MPTARNPTGQEQGPPDRRSPYALRVDGGRFPAKAAVGDVVTVEADAFLDGHDLLAYEVRHRHVSGASLGHRGHGSHRQRPVAWHRSRCPSSGVTVLPSTAWVDRFGTWRRDLKARLDAGQDASADLLVGADLFRRAARRNPWGGPARFLTTVAGDLADAEQGLANRVVERVLGDELAEVVRRYPDRVAASSSGELSVFVDVERARFSTWYELFPRSASPDPDRHGTLADVEARLPYLEQLGIDVLYLPAHPCHQGRPAARATTGNRWPVRAGRAPPGPSLPKAATPQSTRAGLAR